MSKYTTNWSSSETWQRVIASMIAAGTKPDLKAAALYFGTTYDTLENRFRPIKKLAMVLKEEVDSGTRRAFTTPSRAKTVSGTPKTKTPKKSVLETVSTGRVTKKAKGEAASVKGESGSEEDTVGSPESRHTVNTPIIDSAFGDLNLPSNFLPGVDAELVFPENLHYRDDGLNDMGLGALHYRRAGQM